MPGEVPGTGSAHRRAGTSDGCLEALAGPGAVAARGSAAGPRRVRRRAAGEAGACGSGAGGGGAGGGGASVSSAGWGTQG